jgi:endonuclease-3
MKRIPIDKVLKLLKKKYPLPRIALRSENPWELLVATILSAQCTDARVNIVTEALFKKYKTIQDYVKADLKIFQQDIRSTGFYRNKAKNIIASAHKIVRDFGAKVPQDMEGLLQLPGVARKTANVVLFNAFGKNVGIAVDTHVQRVSQRLGLTKNSDPVKIEQDLMKALDRKVWGTFSLRLIRHGREVCVARSPRCPECVLKGMCPSKKLFFPKGC